MAPAAVEGRISPEASPQTVREAFCAELLLKDAEIDKLTQLWGRAKSEVKALKAKLDHAWADRARAGRGSPLPPQVAKMLAHLGNENEHERLTALKKIERALKEKRLNWSDVANRLRSA